ncbi:uncharacterized protein DFL_005330 [Arthrobotrys flagrans]|uniref:Uncharacterized protein n=1 Tax=Arthrobotrys flagrans TaxID=97331 RepID=A0A437A7C2_ARTFL|nr:hypothetical protein DFL_005330 [Arthrobotrys flagrans]
MAGWSHEEGYSKKPCREIVGPDRVAFDGPYCLVGLWKNGYQLLDRDSWTGWALGKPELDGDLHSYWNNIRDNNNGLSGQCNNLKDLNGNLPRQLSSFQVTGYCECEFFADEDCHPKSFRFSAYNREDAAMWRNGKDDNMIQSIKCKYAESWGGVEGFTVTFVDNKTARRDDQVGRLGPIPEGVALQGTWSPDVLRAHDSRKCLKVGHPDVASGNFRVTDVTVVHATCHFYLDENCNEQGGGMENSLFTLASMGKVEWVDPDGGDARGKSIRSYKCFPSYNIAWHPQSQDILKYIQKKIRAPA